MFIIFDIDVCSGADDANTQPAIFRTKMTMHFMFMILRKPTILFTMFLKMAYICNYLQCLFVCLKKTLKILIDI